MATPNYDINYNDKRFTEVEADKKAALNEVDVTYGNMIASSDKYYQQQIDAAKDYADTQKKNQQAQTDFAIEKIEQQKAQAQKDYIKEQSGAYVDWQKQSNPYGVNAEQMADMGMENTGYSESSQVRMYNTYQNRVTAARESYNLAVLNYDNAIKDAQLQNNAILAEIAYNALQQQLELSLQGFQYKNQLILDKANKKLELDKYYYTQYQDVLDQINKENTLKEEVRQYNEKMAEEKRQADMTNARQKEQIAIAQAELKLQQDKFAYEKSKASTISKSSGGGSSSKKSSGSKSTVSKAKSGSTGGTKSVSTGKATSDTAKKKTTNATIDMSSVLALGYGPISPAKLNELKNMGVIEQYVSGNKIKFRKVFKR
jgi:hypothetical protein